MNDTPSRSSTDFQAVVTLKAARDVAETIEEFRRALRAKDLSRRQRQSFKDQLLEAAERLCNLLDLLMSWLDTVSPSVRAPLGEGISELRGKLLATGMKLVADRTQRLIESASAIVGGRAAFPLGISMTLGVSVATLLAIVEALGGRAAMSDDINAKITEVERLLKRLRIMEYDLGLTKELGEQ
ncbi:MAG TPA: hypothetical protein VK558_09870 [Patescibacteria group bacterium]|nr:hypothetical protein [Patescibacteria group bacterium]